MWDLIVSVPDHCLSFYFRDFQYKIDNKNLVTNSFLSSINRIDSGLCTYCNENEEKIFHMFLECHIVNQFRNQLKNWFETNTNIIYTFELAVFPLEVYVNEGRDEV